MLENQGAGGESAMTTKTADLQNSTPALFGLLMDNFPDMIHSVDKFGNIIFFNRMALELLGYTESELTGMNIRQLYAPEVLAAVEKGFVEIKQSDEKRVESLFLARDGTRIPVEIRTLSIRDSNGTFVQTFSISRDIRKLKEMQDNLLHSGRLAAIGELAAGVAHDINNPLSSVALGVSMLQQVLGNCKVLPGHVRDQANELFAMISDSTTTLDSVTARLRDFSRGAKESYAPVDLFDPIHSAILVLGNRFAANKIQTLCPFIKAKHWVFGDRNQIEQVFINLFANAYDAMAERDVRELTVDIVQETRDERPFWRCTVHDTGEGIKPENLERVFAAFYTTKPSGKGVGLGLSIARSILTEHGGGISVESECGQGATFSVWLPIYSQRTSFIRPSATT
jgi:PAS domain S-box-containing protein